MTKDTLFQSITSFSSKAELTYLAIPETIVFKISFRSSRSSPPVASQSANQMHPFMGNACTFSQYLVPETPPPPHLIYPYKVSSSVSNIISYGDPHLHAWASSAAPHFSLCHGTYLPKCGVSAPPPPSLRALQNLSSFGMKCSRLLLIKMSINGLISHPFSSRVLFYQLVMYKKLQIKIPSFDWLRLQYNYCSSIMALV